MIHLSRLGRVSHGVASYGLAVEAGIGVSRFGPGKAVMERQGLAG